LLNILQNESARDALQESASRNGHNSRHGKAGWERALLYVRTAGQLRWEQWVYRAVRRLQRTPLTSAVTAVRLSPKLGELADAAGALAGSNIHRHIAKAEAVASGEFTFIGQTRHLERIEWAERHVNHLWSYNLHYFDFARDLAAAFHATRDDRYRQTFETLVLSWIEENPAGAGDGWDPYPLSVRAVNWMHALLLLGNALPEHVHREIVASLHFQLEVLEKRLEFHILGNHLLKNLHALAVGGMFFDGPVAARWGDKAMRLLARELEEQVLEDGCHFERAPMYHALVLTDPSCFLSCTQPNSRYRPRS
jgi:uncharacterized heparinase superfamily protein